MIIINQHTGGVQNNMNIWMLGVFISFRFKQRNRLSLVVLHNDINCTTTLLQKHNFKNLFWYKKYVFKKVFYFFK